MLCKTRGFIFGARPNSSSLVRFWQIEKTVFPIVFFSHCPGNHLGACISAPQTERTWKRHPFFRVPRWRPFKPFPHNLWTYHGQTPSTTNFSNEFRPLQLLSVALPSLPTRGAFFRRIFRWKNRTFFRWKNINHDQRKCKWWKIGTFFAGFLAQNPLDFVSFSAAENHIFFADSVGLTSLVLSFLSVLSPSDSTYYKQFLL